MTKVYLFSLCLVLTSCFQITEKIHQYSNESGQYSLMVDFSESWFKTKSAIFLGEVDGVRIPEKMEIKKRLMEYKRDALKIQGISKVETSYDFNNYIFSIRFSYSTIASLNAALNLINYDQGEFIHFKFNDGLFERIASYPLPEDLKTKEKRKETLSAALITAVYTFDKTIYGIKNPEGKLSKSKKTVFLRHTVWDVLQDNSLMNNSIRFTP